MVLPSGLHVRMAPTTWATESDDGYPKTEEVTGYCNNNTQAVDESLWQWIDCEDDLDFNELWFAARGGGGGTYGIVTSLHYQLHDYPGILQIVNQNPAVYPPDAAASATAEAQFYLQKRHVEFILRFLYLPETFAKCLC